MPDIEVKVERPIFLPVPIVFTVMSRNLRKVDAASLWRAIVIDLAVTGVGDIERINKARV